MNDPLTPRDRAIALEAVRVYRRESIRAQLLGTAIAIFVVIPLCLLIAWAIWGHG